MLEIGFEVTVAEPAPVYDPTIESLLYNALELRKPEKRDRALPAGPYVAAMARLQAYPAIAQEARHLRSVELALEDQHGQHSSLLGPPQGERPARSPDF